MKTEVTNKMLRLALLPHGEGLPLPTYETAGSSGLDLRAALPDGEPLALKPMERALVPTGLQIALPPGYEGQVRPRSGLAHKLGLTVLNTPGTIDNDYRGEVKVILINFGSETISVKRGDRVAQLVLSAYEQLVPVKVASLDSTARGGGGFGSTGTA